MLLLLAGTASAGPAEWELNEVERAGPGGNTAIRFVELYAAQAGCWFPSTQVAVYDAGGTVLDAVAPFASTTCFGDDTYLLLATTGAEALYGVIATTNQVPTIPANARQICFRSTGTIYDCVRWGAQTVVIHDLFGPTDDSSAPAPPTGGAIARIASSHVVSDDWIAAEPTPGGINDGTPIEVPDAGPEPDAGPPADAELEPDAGPPPDADLLDAAPAPDAHNSQFLDLDPGGGAGCGCQGGADPSLLLGLLLVVSVRRTSSAASRRRDRGPRVAPTSRPARRAR
jgi:hypothetical protein